MVARTWRDDVAEMNEGVKVEDSDGDKLEIVNGAVKEVDRASGSVVSGATDPSIIFGANTSAATELTLATLSAIPGAAKEHILTVENMSATTAMTISIKLIEANFNGSSKNSVLTQISVPVSSVRSVIIKGAMIIDTIFTASNDVQITDSLEGNRKVTMRLREL